MGLPMGWQIMAKGMGTRGRTKTVQLYFVLRVGLRDGACAICEWEAHDVGRKF